MSPDIILANVIFAVGLIIAITFHEFSHAFVADHFGDPTPRAHGRVSLNPLRHLDPLGTVMLLLVHFGWGKPVPIDPYNLTRNEEILVSLAGPGSNLVLAVIGSLLVHYLPIPMAALQLIAEFVLINITLAVFNLLPVPPLDGSKLFLNLLSPEKAVEWEQAFDRYGFFLLAILLFLPVNGSNIINIIISPIINFLLRLLGIS